MGDQVPDHRIIEMVGRDCGSLWNMDLAAKLEKIQHTPACTRISIHNLRYPGPSLSIHTQRAGRALPNPLGPNGSARLHGKVHEAIADGGLIWKAKDYSQPAPTRYHEVGYVWKRVM